MIIERILWLTYKSLLKAAAIQKPVIQSEIKFKNNCLALRGYIWVFCTTIGELNACKHFLRKYAGEKMVFITDKNIYIDAFDKEFPESISLTIKDYILFKSKLLVDYPPIQLIICEIPCSLHEAPCRFEYSLIRDIYYKSGNVVVINGWLYADLASCKQDRLEQILFNKYFYKFVSLYFVQDEEVKIKLMKLGVGENKINVIPSFKFDRLSCFDDSDLIETDNIKKISNVFRQKVFTAGSLSGIEEFQLIIDAFSKVDDGETVLIIAPRHPEFSENIDKIKTMLSKLSINYRLLSETCISDVKVIIVDTFGDLQYIYSRSDYVYIGKNHNLIEPLLFKKRVCTSDGWSKKYSSYSIFNFCRENNLIKIIDSEEALVDDIRSISSSQNEVNFKYNSERLVIETLESHSLSVTSKC